jgi:hypothetical protein
VVRLRAREPYETDSGLDKTGSGLATSSLDKSKSSSLLQEQRTISSCDSKIVTPHEPRDTSEQVLQLPTDHIGFNMTMAATRLRAVQIVAAAFIGLILWAAFRTGLVRDLHSTLADQSWGRVQFVIGSAITSLYHGGYGYTISDVIRNVLANAGLTATPDMLKAAGLTFPENLRDPTVIENAIKKAIAHSWPFNPNEQVTGSSGDDVGLVDYVRLSFILFGEKVVGFFLTYFMLVGTSFLAAIIAFRKIPGILAVFVLYAVALFVLFKSALLDLDVVGILDPRFLSTLALVPAAHIALAMLVQLRPSAGQVGLVALQSVILIFGYWIRSSAFWTMLGLMGFATLIAGYALWRRQPKQLVRNWPFAVLALLAAGHFMYASMVLHPIYQSANERAHHVLWHALLFGVAIHPDWPTKHAAQFELGDAVPEMMARKYLERHPPENPDAVYLTPDRKYLRIGVAETYKRKAFLEFLANDPRFVFEAYFVHNPKLVKDAFVRYLSSLDRLFVADWVIIILASLIAGTFLFADPRGYWEFSCAILIMTGAFLVSIAPVLVTAPGPHTLADQFFMLIVVILGLIVLSISFIGVIAPRLHRVRGLRRKPSALGMSARSVTKCSAS